MDWELPQEVTGRILSDLRQPGSPGNVPADFAGALLYADGTSASFYCSFTAENQQWAVISGTRGHLHVSDFVLPFAGETIGFDLLSPEYHIDGCDFRMEPGRRHFEINEQSHGTPNSQESNLFRQFSAQVLTGHLNPVWPEAALKTQQVMQACLKSAQQHGQPCRITRA